MECLNRKGTKVIKCGLGDKGKLCKTENVMIIFRRGKVKLMVG